MGHQTHLCHSSVADWLAVHARQLLALRWQEFVFIAVCQGIANVFLEASYFTCTSPSWVTTFQIRIGRFYFAKHHLSWFVGWRAFLDLLRQSYRRDGKCFGRTRASSIFFRTSFTTQISSFITIIIFMVTLFAMKFPTTWWNYRWELCCGFFLLIILLDIAQMPKFDEEHGWWGVEISLVEQLICFAYVFGHVFESCFLRLRHGGIITFIQLLTHGGLLRKSIWTICIIYCR